MMTKAQVLARVNDGAMALKNQAIHGDSEWWICGLCNQHYENRTGKITDRYHVRAHRDLAASDLIGFWHQTRAIHGMIIVPGMGEDPEITRMCWEWTEQDFKLAAGRLYWRSDHAWTRSHINGRMALLREAGFVLRRIRGTGSNLLARESYQFILDLVHDGAEVAELIAIFENMKLTRSTPEAA